MSPFLSKSQVEAHVARLVAIRTQLRAFRDSDVRAQDAFLAVDSALESLQGEAREPDNEVAETSE